MKRAWAFGILLSAACATSALAQPATQPATAVDAYLAAVDLLKAEGPSSNVNYAGESDRPPYPADWVAFEKAAYEQNAPARALVRRTAALPPGNWPTIHSDRRPNPMATKSLNGSRALANDLADAACYVQTLDRQNEALDYLDDLERLAADLRGEPGPTGGLIRLLVGIGIDAIRTDRLLLVAPLLDLSPDARDPVDPKRLRATIDGLLLQTPGKQRWFELGEVRHPTPGVEPVSPDTNHRGLLAIDRVNAEKTFVAVSLACQLFKAEQGRWPASVEEFVPLYLPAMPPDPWAVPSMPFGYVLEKGALPDGTDRPMVFHRYESADGLKPPTTGPIYHWYRGDGTTPAPPGHPPQHGQYRDIAAWPTTRPAK